MIRKQCLLNDIFQNKAQNQEQFFRQSNITKFVQCFNSSTGKRNRQIRILQIGGSCNTKIYKKPFISTQPIKNCPPSVLLNNEILFRSNLNEAKDNCFFIQGVRKNQTQKITMPNTEFTKGRSNIKNNAITSSYRGRAWTSRNAHVDKFPKDFYLKNHSSINNRDISPRKNRQDDSCQIPKIQSPQEIQRKKSSKSVNFINKIKGLEDYPIMKNIQPATVHIQRKNGKLLQKNQQQIAQQERKAKLQIKRQISLDYAKPFNPPTNISAFSYIVFQPKFSSKKQKQRIYQKFLMDGYSDQSPKKQNKVKFPHSHKVLVSQNSRTQVEVASLTKIMTCIVALDLCEKFKVKAEEQSIHIGKFQSQVGGTTAQIAPGEIYTLQDLYYGLMLPSGNDASVAIAVWGGRYLLTKKQTDNGIVFKKKQCYFRFIEEMNNFAKKLGMQKTNYANSHGLVNSANKSCAYDLSILCEYAMSNLKFRRIVSTRIYSTVISYYLNGSVPLSIQQSALSSPRKSQRSLNQARMIKDQDQDDQILEGDDIQLDSNQQSQGKDEQMQISQKKVQWQNTHRLLQQKPSQYVGIKTGITEAAGPCLASCVQTTNHRYFIIIVLNCDKMSMRFKDTENLKKWAFQKEGLTSPKKSIKISQNLDAEIQSSKKLQF